MNIDNLVSWIRDNIDKRCAKGVCFVKAISNTFILMEHILNNYNIKHEILDVAGDEGIYKAYVTATNNNLLLLSNINRNEFEFIRDYSKLYCLADLHPLVSFSNTSILNSCKYLQLTIADIPTNKFGFTNEELEWIYDINIRTNIILSESDPTKYSGWFGFTVRQKEIIAKIHQIEKMTRHKINNNIPIYTEN